MDHIKILTADLCRSSLPRVFVRGLGFVVALLVHLGIDFYVCLLGVNPAVVVFESLSIGQSIFPPNKKCV